MLDVLLDVLIRELAADETLDVEDGSVGVGRSLVLGGVTNKSFLIGEGDIRRGNTVSLVVDENLDLALLHHTNATTRLLVSLSPITVCIVCRNRDVALWSRLTANAAHPAG